MVRAAALTDDEVRAIHDHHDHHDRLQIAGYRQVIDIAHSKGPLRADLTPETATEVLLTLCGDSVWVQLTARGWTPDQVTHWLAATVPTDPARAPPDSP